jgi:prefoldin alpha subunit
MAEDANAPLDVEQALAVLDSYNRQIEAVARQVNLLQAVLAETVRARQSLAGLRDEPSQEILVPLGANTFLRAQASEKEKVLTGIGAGVTVETSWNDAEKRLTEREGDLQRELQRLSDGLLRLQQEAAALQAELEADVGPGRSRGA